MKRWKRISIWGAILMSLLVFSCLIRIWNEKQNFPPEIAIRTKNVNPGEPIEITMKNAKSSDVSGCVWYVGDKVVSRTEKIAPYVTEADDAEQFVRVEVFLKDGSVYKDSLYCSLLPVVYIECETLYEDLTYDSETAQIQVAAGGECLYTELYNGSGTVKLRGNSTSRLPKIPFKIRLDEKADLLGMGESKHWVLLANALDASLIRNKLVYDLSRDIGAETWMDSEMVSVVYNGDYIGLYQLCEQVRVAEGRVDIYNWEDVAEKAVKKIVSELKEQGLIEKAGQQKLQLAMEAELNSGFSWMETKNFVFGSLLELQKENENISAVYDLTEYIDFESLPDPQGGVLLEMDFFHEDDASLKTNYAMPFYFNRPSSGESYKALQENICEELQALEYAFHDTDFRYHEESPHYQVSNEGWFIYGDVFARDGVAYESAEFEAEQYDGLHYSELIDFDSLMVNFLLCEFTMNWDGMKNSVFLYKDTEGPFSIGPAWDYDWAWGNGDYDLFTWITDDWHTTNEWFANECYYQSVQWNRYLIRDPYFLVRIYEKYWEIRDTVIEDMICEGGLIDQYKESLLFPAMANDEKWGGCEGNYAGRKFEEGIEYLKMFIEERLTWLDAQFASIETLRESLGYYMTSETIWVESMDTENYEGETEIHVCVTDPSCKAVSFQVNGTHFFEAEVKEGMAVVRIPDEALRTEKGAINTVQVRAVDGEGKYLVNPEGTVEGDYSNAVSNYAHFAKEI